MRMNNMLALGIFFLFFVLWGLMANHSKELRAQHAKAPATFLDPHQLGTAKFASQAYANALHRQIIEDTSLRRLFCQPTTRVTPEQVAREVETQFTVQYQQMLMAHGQGTFEELFKLDD